MISCIDRRVKRYSFGLVDLCKKFNYPLSQWNWNVRTDGTKVFSANECSHAQSIWIPWSEHTTTYSCFVMQLT